MKNSKNDDPFRFRKIEDRIRKAAHADTPDSVVLDRVAIRMFRSKVDCTLNLPDESGPEARPSFVVPQSRVVKFGPRSRPKDDH